MTGARPDGQHLDGVRLDGVLSPWRLTGIAAPMLLWALHLVVVYSLQGVTCAEGLALTRHAGLTVLAWSVLALTAVTFALLAWLGRRARRGWQPHTRPLRARARRATPLRRGASGALCVLSAVAVLFTTIPVLLLPGCAGHGRSLKPPTPPSSPAPSRAAWRSSSIRCTRCWLCSDRIPCSWFR